MKRFLSMLSLLAAMAGASAPLSSASAQETVKHGFEAFANDGTDRAIKVWLDGSPLEPSEAEAKRALGAVKAEFGRTQGSEIVQTHWITKQVTRTYGILYYEKGILYVAIDAYYNGVKWIVTDLTFEKTARKVFPEELLFTKPNR